MRKIKLGRTGLEVSRVGIGGIPLTRPSLEEVVTLVNRALDLGVNFIDTANGYSTSEERIGLAIEDRREDVIPNHQDRNKGQGDGTRTPRLEPQETENGLP